MIYKASAAWLSKVIDCSGPGIEKYCKGCCCKSNFYPATIPGVSKNRCIWLTENGCMLPIEEMPVKCLLYPLWINNNYTIIVHGRALLAFCKKNYRQGNKSILENMRKPLSVIWGEEITQAMYESIAILGRDFVFRMPNEAEYALKTEDYLEANNIPPLKRSEYKEFNARTNNI